MKRFWISLIVAALSLFVITSSASAMDLVAGVQLQGGAGQIEEDEGEDNEMGYGGGARLYGLVKFMPALAAGLNFDYRYYSHSVEGNDDASIGVSLPSVGLILRSDIAPMFTLDLVANYHVAASLSADSGEGSSMDFDLSGFMVGVDALYRIQIPPFKTYVEVGPYFTWHSLETEIEVMGQTSTDDDTYMTFGLAAQGTFEFGM